MSFLSLNPSSTGYQVVRSLAVISAIDYLRPMIGGVVSNVAGGYTGILTDAIMTYLLFIAYSQGWISVPSGLVSGGLSA